jgi:hypothetical protein
MIAKAFHPYGIVTPEAFHWTGWVGGKVNSLLKPPCRKNPATTDFIQNHYIQKY